MLEFVRVERFLASFHALPGRPQEDRAALARAFSTFADSALPSRLHEVLIEKTMQGHLVGHVSRDSTAIKGREKPTPKPPPKPKRGRGRPRRGDQRPKQHRRLQRQPQMTRPQMLEDLPRVCDVGVKRNAKGHQESWVGCKLHIDAADGAVPLSCILTSASLHDSHRAAIPLATLTAARVTNLHDLMDSACDAPEIRAHSESLGHVALIDVNPRNAARQLELKTETQAQRAAGHVYPEHLRYRERTTVERVNGRLKDEFGARQGAMPPDVWHSGADGDTVAAPAKQPRPGAIHLLQAARSPGRGVTGQRCPYTATDAESSVDFGQLATPEPSWRRIRRRNVTK